VNQYNHGFEIFYVKEKSTKMPPCPRVVFVFRFHLITLSLFLGSFACPIANAQLTGDPKSWVGLEVVPTVEAKVQGKMELIPHFNFSVPMKIESLSESKNYAKIRESFAARIQIKHLIAASDARKYYDDLIDREPDNVLARCLRANFLKYSNSQIAMQDCEHAIKINPKCEFAYYIRGWIYYRSVIVLPGTGERVNRYDEAIADFEKAIELNKEFAGPHFGIGLIRYIRNEFKLAKEEYGKAIEIRPKAGYYRWRASARTSLKEGEADIHEDREEAVRLDNQDPWNLYALGHGLTHGAIVDFERAEKLLINACEIDGWNNNSFSDTLRTVYQKTGNEEKLEWLRSKKERGKDKSLFPTITEGNGVRTH
jgi:tetratricopeptide (TPR) repeat protein